MVCVYVCVLVTYSCLTLCDPVDCSPPGSSLHGILQNTGMGCHFLLQCVCIYIHIMQYIYDIFYIYTYTYTQIYIYIL